MNTPLRSLPRPAWTQASGPGLKVRRRAADAIDRVGRSHRTVRAWWLLVAAVMAIVGATGTVACASAHSRAKVTARHARVVRPTLIGVGNVPGCMSGSASGLSVLRAYHAKVLRIVIDPRHGATGQAQGCLQAAVGSGYRVHIAISYSNRWSRARIVAYFRQVLAFYAPDAWAISIGNEQELNQGGAKESGAQYAAVWRAVEPVVAHLAPHAIRVAGEISPWGINFLRAAYARHLPGLQAVSAHAYRSHFGFDLPKVVSWARATHQQLWITEGLGGPGAWPSNIPGMHTVPLSSLAGATVADAWLG